MTHIEFLGPPGSGKTTIFEGLIEEKKYFGGVREDAVRRAAGTKGRFALSIVPQTFESVLYHRVIKSPIYIETFDTFIGGNPEYLTASGVLLESVDQDTRFLFQKLRLTATRYQLASETSHNGETVCLDEGFWSRAAAAEWRSGDASPIEEYLEVVPLPIAVVYIDAPIGICLTRQQARGNIVSSGNQADSIRQNQKQRKQSCDRVRKLALENDVPVLTIENTGSIDEAVSKVKQQLDELIPHS